jgi:hypothetical protein
MIKFVLQQVGQLVKVRAVIWVDDHSDGEHAGNRNNAPRIAMGGGPVADALWARTAAATCARRSATPPLVGTPTSIGLTRLPTADPPLGRRPETGTATAIGSTDSPLFNRSRSSAAPTATRTASFVVAPFRCAAALRKRDPAGRQPCCDVGPPVAPASSGLRAPAGDLRQRTWTDARTATNWLPDVCPGTGSAMRLEQGFTRVGPGREWHAGRWHSRVDECR